MTRREKILATVTGGLAGVVVVWWIVDTAILQPAERSRERIRNLTAEVQEMETASARKAFYRRKLVSLDGRGYGEDEASAAAALRDRLLMLMTANQLSTESISPIRGRTVPKVYREIGWSVHARGRMENVVTFLYQLQAEPSLQRVEGLSLQPVQRADRIDLRLRCTTLVLHKAKGETLAEDRTPATAPADPEDSRRELYDVIARRDLFRPYVQRVARATPEPQPQPQPQPRPQPPAGPDASRYRIVDLSSWGGADEVVVADLYTRQNRRYKEGDMLMDGQIVMVDYRPRPKPDEPEILSGSRVILRVQGRLYAVELGDRLSQRRRLREAQLPDELREATTAPAANAAHVADSSG